MRYRNFQSLFYFFFPSFRLLPKLEYIIIHNKSLKINLLSKKGSWSFKLSGKSWVVADCLERLYAYLILGENNINETSGTLRANYKHITPIEIDEFVTHFRATHPVEDAESSLDNIVTYATPDMPLIIPNPFSYNVLLTATQEMEIIKIIKGSQYSRKEMVRGWFSGYIHRYGLTPRCKRDVEMQEEVLALSFCQTHGIDYYGLDAMHAAKQQCSNVWMRWCQTVVHFLIAEALFALSGYIALTKLLSVVLPSDDKRTALCIALCICICTSWAGWWNYECCSLKLYLKDHLWLVVWDVMCAIAFMVIVLLAFLIAWPFFAIFT